MMRVQFNPYPTLNAQHSTLNPLNSAAILLANRMQAAFGLFHAAPAASPLVGFVRRDGARARPAADARKALVVQRVIRDRFVGDSLPNVLLRPIRKRADLHQTEL